MPRKPKYTDQELKELIEGLIHERKEIPNVRETVDAIGEGAHPKRIGPILNEIKNEKSIREQLDLPETVEKKILDTGAAIYRYLEKLSMSKVEVIQKESDLKIKNLEAQVEEHLDGIAQLMAENKSQAETINLHQKSEKNRSTIIKSRENEIVQLEKNIIILETKLKEREVLENKQKEEIANLRNDFSNLQKDFVKVASIAENKKP